jgi:hypothetical protein
MATSRRGALPVARVTVEASKVPVPCAKSQELWPWRWILDVKVSDLFTPRLLYRGRMRERSEQDEKGKTYG